MHHYRIRISPGRDRMVVGLTTICVINAYRHECCQFKSRSLGGVLDTTLCGKFVNDQRYVDGFLRELRLPPPRNIITLTLVIEPAQVPKPFYT